MQRGSLACVRRQLGAFVKINSDNLFRRLNMIADRLMRFLACSEPAPLQAPSLRARTESRALHAIHALPPSSARAPEPEQPNA